MLQKLAGRLRWEESSGGILIEIPTRPDWWVVIGTFVIALWSLLGLSIAPLRFFTNDNPGTTAWLSATGFLVIACLSASLLLWNFTGKTIFVLDAAEMRITRYVLGIRWNTRGFETRGVRNLRYIPSSGFRVSRSYIPSVIRFDADNKTHKLASRISDIEAFALIDRALDVYEIPKGRALEYIGIR